MVPPAAAAQRAAILRMELEEMVSVWRKNRRGHPRRGESGLGVSVHMGGEVAGAELGLWCAATDRTSHGLSVVPDQGSLLPLGGGNRRRAVVDVG